MIDINKKYRYRNGEPARVLCVDGFDEKYPVVTMDGDGGTLDHTIDGRAYDDKESEYDLIEINEEDELLEEAKRRYAGNPVVRSIYDSGGDFKIDSSSIHFEDEEIWAYSNDRLNSRLLYDQANDKWAEIITESPEKAAIKKYIEEIETILTKLKNEYKNLH